MQINEPAIDFSLTDLGGKTHRLMDHLGQTVVIDFWSCECPHSARTDSLLVAMKDRWAQDVIMLFIASNRNETADSIREAAEERRLPLVLRDAEQVVANLYEAQTTPHIFVIDPSGTLRYRGAVDDVTFRQRNPTRFFLDEALHAVLAEKLPSPGETPAYGCTIVRED